MSEVQIVSLLVLVMLSMVRLRGLGLCCAALAGFRSQLHVAAGAARRHRPVTGIFRDVFIEIS